LPHIQHEARWGVMRVLPADDGAAAAEGTRHAAVRRSCPPPQEEARGTASPPPTRTGYVPRERQRRSCSRRVQPSTMEAAWGASRGAAGTARTAAAAAAAAAAVRAEHRTAAAGSLAARGTPAVPPAAHGPDLCSVRLRTEIRGSALWRGRKLYGPARLRLT
jgi:hypothetical protein